jgi:predicted Rossmann fold flavoprotein
VIIAVIGGGAAGFFGAITCAEANPDCQVVIFEKTRQLLSKVKISGGGRCNVTHACFDPYQMTLNYPRGSQALRGAFTRFQPTQTREWFESRGVRLKTEEDGRMFPTSDSSSTIIRCLSSEAERLKVQIRTEADVESIDRRNEGGFYLNLRGGERVECDKILLATGGMKKGHELAASLGHQIVPAVPSLFTLNIADSRLEEISGLAVQEVAVSLVGTPLKTTGPLLVTHWGMSGPAILRLSAWGARLFAERGYEAEIEVNWLPALTGEKIEQTFQEIKQGNPRKQVFPDSPFPAIPRNLWRKLVTAAGISSEKLYAQFSKEEMKALKNELIAARFKVSGKSTYKDEFVTCGGVNLDEVSFKTMESRLVPGLFFAGEVLDIDGITGGFNFQNAWTTGFIAGHAMASSSSSKP